MRATILSIGSELLRGDIVDTNAAFLSRELTWLGFEVSGISQVADDVEALERLLARDLDSNDVAVTTGGLGPTADDVTRDAIARVFEEKMQLDGNLLRGIADRFADRDMPPSNRNQAMLIPSARPIPNDNGTAPGWYVSRGGQHIVALPGPPGEMIPMWEKEVRGRLRDLLPGHLVTRSMMTFGLGESSVEHRIQSVIGRRGDVTIATYAKQTGVQVHVSARAPSHEIAEARVHDAVTEIQSELGEAVFGEGAVTLAEVVGKLLASRLLTLAVMESVTGGELANLITAVDGSSHYFTGGIVAYTRTAKAQYGVPEQIVQNHGLISGQTAVAMADAARQQMGSDIGLATTGVAGNEAIEGEAAGTAFIAISRSLGSDARKVTSIGPRQVIKHRVAQSALDLLRRQLLRDAAQA
ncbi:MAG: CinA family nicotinamide mononucleotide deamidase-related protein [Chloroflexota bacterium]